jgi:hypothetical protein
MVTIDTQKIVKENAKRRDQKKEKHPFKKKEIQTYIHIYIYTQNCVSENETGESEVNVM